MRQTVFSVLTFVQSKHTHPAPHGWPPSLQICDQPSQAGMRPAWVSNSCGGGPPPAVSSTMFIIPECLYPEHTGKQPFALVIITNPPAAQNSA